MSAILSGSNAYICCIRSFSVGRRIGCCRNVGTTIAQRSRKQSELLPTSGRRCFRLIGSTPFTNPPGNSGNNPYARRIAIAAVAAFASGACFARLGTMDDSGMRGPTVARMASRRDTSLQIRFGDSLLVDHIEPRSSKTIAGANDEEIVLLLPKDKETLSPFLYYMMTQVKLVRVQNDDNHKHNLPIGLPGLGCVHCKNCTIFPLDRRTFPNMVRKHLYNQMRRCERCPPEVKLELKRLKNLEIGTKISREERLFFKELWFRMGHKRTI